MKLKSNTPRHRQISDWIREQIDNGTYHVDEKLPSENDFTDKFGVSRVTVRKALQTLENEQRIYRCQGLGSFVADVRSHQSFAQLNDFVEDMKQAGMQASSRVIGFKQVEARDKIASILNVESGALVVQLERLRLGDGQPIAFDITWLPMFYGQLIEDVDLEQDTIYNVLESQYDLPVEKGCYRIEAANAAAETAAHLDVPKHQALLLIDRLSLTTGEKPVYYQKRYYRTDRIVYELKVQRQKGHPSTGNGSPLQELMPVFKSPA